MSEIHAQHCAKKNTNLQKKLFFTFLSSIILLILLGWFILHPNKPQFSLKEADVYQLVVSGTHLLNSSIQLTLVSTNPNQRVEVYYDEIQVYASYKSQQITLPSSLPPFYQDHEGTNLLSALLVANALPVAPSLIYELGRDQTFGRLVLNLNANGLLRWKLGPWVSGKYRFNVNCVAVLAFAPAGPLTWKQGTQCCTRI